MKTLKKTLFSMALAAGVIGTSLAPAWAANISEKLEAPQADKGRDGGGGNTVPTELATENDILNAIETAKWATQFAFFGMQSRLVDVEEDFLKEKSNPQGFNDWDLQDEYHGLKLLFGDSSDARLQELLKIVSAIRFDVRKDKPCFYEHDPKKAPMDASAEPSGQTVCFSVSQIRAREVPSFEIESQVAALFIHEVVHLIARGLPPEAKAREEQVAVAIQKQVLDFELLGRKFSPFANVHTGIRLASEDTMKELLEIREVLSVLDSGASAQDKCEDLREIALPYLKLSRATHPLYEVENEWVSQVMRDSDSAKLEVAIFKIVNSVNACDKKVRKDSMRLEIEAFQAGPITVHAYDRLLWNRDPQDEDGDGKSDYEGEVFAPAARKIVDDNANKISAVHLGDFAQVKIELERAARLIEEVLQNLDASLKFEWHE